MDVEELMKGGTEVSAKEDDESDSGSDWYDVYRHMFNSFYMVY